ncbi:MAG: hypothetical protein RBS99_16700 [Rhodospirillales bacterium]|jgi:hypothetical protein|nr:hypothetical protein [Rhodospirillales bacterium]
MSDLVERLRKQAVCVYLAAEAGPANDISASLKAAADEIERLRAENFALAADQCHDGYAGDHGEHRCREIERLRKALTEIEAIDLQWADGLDTNVERIKSLARAALSDKRTGGDDA